MKKIISILISSAICFPLFAELEIGKKNDKPMIPTWESYEFMKYGTVGASLYTGMVNYSIPVYTYKDNDFEFPISIEYANGGYRANHSSGLVGEGWSLSCVGRITRKVRGIPDEEKKLILDYLGSGYNYWGYSHIHIDGSQPLSPDMIYQSNSHAYTCFNPGQGNTRYETEPDEYTFNFCGYSGSFQRTGSNIPVNGQQFYVYDASGESRGLKISISPGSNPQEFEIIDLKGYKYEFKCDEYYQYYEYYDPATPHKVTTSWTLSKITAPSGRTINFTYTAHTYNFNDASYHPTQNYYHMFGTVGCIAVDEDGTEIQEHKYFTRKLTSIDFCGNEKVFFEMEDGQDEWRYTDRDFTEKANAHIFNKKLDNIKVTLNGEVIKTCKFNYSTNITGEQAQNGGGNCVTFLKGLNVSGEGQYSFSYINENGYYPYLGTCEYDHWGYYNGQGNGFRVHGAADFKNKYLSYDSNYDETIKKPSKNPSFDAAVSGSLSRITYPTGGYSLIEYESHDYSMEVVRKWHAEMRTSFLPELDALSYNKQAGGVRVKQVITHKNDEEPNDTTTYIYTSGTNPALSSGIMIAPPRYGVEYFTSDNKKHVEFYQLSNSMFDYKKNHIEYSTVKEIKSGRGSTVYDYSTSLDAIDEIYDGGNDNVDRIQIPTCGMTEDGTPILHAFTPCSRHVENLLTPAASYQNKRGKLSRISNYNLNGDLLRKQEFGYSYPSVEIDTFVLITGEVAKYIYTPRFDVERIRATTTDYSGNASISQTVNYTYNNLGLLTSETRSTSDAGTLRTNLYYVCDSMSGTGLIADMAASHNLSALLKKEQYKVSDGAEKLLAAVRLEYAHPNASNPALACPVAKYSWLKGQQWELDETYRYDDKGNLIEYTDPRGISESYLWGYNGRYLVALVKNSSFDNLNSLLRTSPSALRDMPTLPDDKFNELKNLGTRQPNSLDSLYRYRPGIGMTEAVAPDLSKATYQYNGYGKLTEMRDNGGHLIQQFDYNTVTVEPFSASLQCGPLCYRNGELTATVSCEGGSGFYSYHWVIVKADGNTVVLEDNAASATLSPMNLQLASGQHCTVECTVEDLVSGEKASLTQSVLIKSCLLYFYDIVENANPSGDSGTVTAAIYCDDDVEANFNLSNRGPGSRDVTVTIEDSLGRKSSKSNFSIGDNGFNLPLHSGVNHVQVRVTNAQGSPEIELTLAGAGSHDIDSSRSTISIQF